MRLPDDVEELHLIAEYHTACRALRQMGWGGIVFGIINIGLGIAFTISLGPINALLVLIGLFLLVSGIWCLALPGAEGVISNGIALILVGLWNILVTIGNVAGGENPQFWWAILGVFLIAAGVQCFRQYARYSLALRHGVSREEAAMMDKLVKTILKANAKEEEDIINFEVRAFTQQKAWRGQLGRNVAVFVEKMSKEVLVAHKEEVRIEPHGKMLLRQSLKASIKIRDHKWEALISPRSFDRFRDWKFREDDDYREDETDAVEREPEKGIRAKDNWDEGPSTDISEGKVGRRKKEQRRFRPEQGDKRDRPYD